MRIVIAGGGVAGFAAALVSARSGHDVVLIERDRVDIGHAQDACEWDRRGVPHFLQPHGFLPRARREMLAALPDVYESLLLAGAYELDIARKLRGPRIAQDDELRQLYVRRPLIEWALRSAAAAEPRIMLLADTRITGLTLRAGIVPRVTAVQTKAGEIAGDLVVDAQGRTTPVPRWLAAAGAAPRAEAAKSYVVYYSRYYRLRPGRQLPDGPWLSMLRGDYGYAGFVTFGGDNGTFATVLISGSWDHDLRILQREAAYEAVSAATPVLCTLSQSDFAEPITPVLAMGELHNTIRHYVEGGRPRVLGLIAVGDAVAHTDPTFALGLSFSLIHARALVQSIEAHGADPEALALAYWGAIYPETRERYDLAVAVDEARARLWHGERLDVTRAAGCYPLFALTAASAAALEDDEVLRKISRRIGFLDRTAVFDADTALHVKIESLVADVRRRREAPAVPARDELLRIARAAVEQQAACG